LAAGRTISVAGGTGVVTGDIEPRLGALDGLPEIDIERVLEILTLLRRLWMRAARHPARRAGSNPKSRSCRNSCRAAVPAQRPDRRPQVCCPNRNRTG